MTWVGKLLSLIGAKRSRPRSDIEPTYQVPASLIDRNPLSYREASDPTSDATDLEIARMKGRRPHGPSGIGPK